MVIDTFLNVACATVKSVSENGALPAGVSLQNVQLAIGRVQIRLGATAPWTEHCRKANSVLKPALENATRLRLAEFKAREDTRRAVKHAKNLRHRANKAKAAEENRIRANKGLTGNAQQNQKKGGKGKGKK